MNLVNELLVITKIIVACLLGGFIGYEREMHGKQAGIRTYATVCVGAALFTVIAEHLADTAAVSRIIANIVVGIGFLGSGVISRSSHSTGSFGLTTAATIWSTAGVGVAIGLDMYIISIVSAIALYMLLSLHHWKWYQRIKEKSKSLAQDDSE